MALRPETIATIEDLKAIRWFSRVGERDLLDAIVLASWEEATQAASSIEWENAGLEAMNDLRVKIMRIDRTRFDQWNEKVCSIKELSNAVIEGTLTADAQVRELPPIVIACLRWDVLGLCMEAEHGDIVDPGFFHAIAACYLSGHFPCGIRTSTARMVVF